MGENDADDSGAVAAWAANFLDLCVDLRSDLSAPDLRFIVTELGPCPDAGAFPYWDDLQAEQQSLDGELDGDVMCVSAADLPVKSGDEVHISTAGLVTLGQRYAAAFGAND